MATAGRPSKLTKKLQEQICQALRAGNYIEPAAAIHGVTKSVLYNWLKRGGKERARLDKSPKARPKKTEKPYLSFVDAIEKAQGLAEARDVAIIAKAAETQWQAAAWRLERKFYSRWGRKAAIEVEANHKGMVRQEYHVTIDQRRVELIKMVERDDLREAMRTLALAYASNGNGNGNGHEPKLLEAGTDDDRG